MVALTGLRLHNKKRGVLSKNSGTGYLYIKRKKVGGPCTISDELNIDETDELNLEELILNQHSPHSVDKSKGCASLKHYLHDIQDFKLSLTREQQ